MVTCRCPAGRRRQRGGQRLQRAVRVRVVGERAQRLADLVGGQIGARFAVLVGDVADGQGAGLVQADDVDPGQALDGGQLLHQDLLPGQLHGGQQERHRGQQHQALRHQPDQAAGGPDHHLLPALVADRPPLRPQLQRQRDDDDPGDVLQQLIDRLLDLGAGFGELLRLGGDLVDVGVRADRRRAEPADPGDNRCARTAPRRRRTWGWRPPRRSGSTRRSPARRSTASHRRRAPDRRCAARSGRREPRPAVGTSISVAVPQHPGGRGVEQRQPIELPLGQVLLHDADQPS